MLRISSWAYAYWLLDACRRRWAPSAWAFARTNYPTADSQRTSAGDAPNDTVAAVDPLQQSPRSRAEKDWRIVEREEAI
jgi:hypothetical protein